ncbi:MAG: Arc family DNA-binding protein [Betaproteobacteria bacterium]|nr:Arc family DNA-binding protein [Betaproteobacteria bacterium]
MKTRTKRSATEQSLFSIRIPAELREELASFADREGRSLNSLIVEMLSDRMKVFRAVEASADKEALTDSYETTETVKLYLQAARDVILGAGREEKHVPAASAPALDFPDAQLTPLQRKLLVEFSRLPAEQQAALLILVSRK